uniref:Uncharacterized protein n=1 Tax=Rhizophora mucronata TaxID=61149 RepID=A0A2P2M8V8_RHIMU
MQNTRSFLKFNSHIAFKKEKGERFSSKWKAIKMGSFKIGNTLKASDEEEKIFSST